MILLTGWGMKTEHQLRQTDTIQFHRDLYTSKWARTLKIVSFPCTTDTTYAEVMRSLWGQDDIISLEHDIVPTMEQFEQMLEATAPVTAQAYYLYQTKNSIEATLKTLRFAQKDIQTYDKLSQVVDLNTLEQIAQAYRKARTLFQLYGTQAPVSVLAHRAIENGVERWISCFEQRADLWGLGFTKITKRAQEAIDPSCLDGHWIRMDDRLSRAAHNAGIRAHVAWPVVQHNHRPEEPIFGEKDRIGAGASE